MQFCLNIKLRPSGPWYPSSKQYALLRPPLASGGIVAPTLLATVQSPNDRHPTPRSSSRVAWKDRCTALRTHGVYAVSRSASPAISAYRRREDRTIACPSRCLPVACNAPPTLSTRSSDMQVKDSICELRAKTNYFSQFRESTCFSPLPFTLERER